MKAKWLIYLLPMFFLTPLQAAGLPPIGSCLIDGLCGGFGLEAAALYWRPCRDDRLYAITDSVNVTETDIFHTADSEYDWGFRLKGIYNTCNCFFADIEYTYFEGCDNDTTTNPVDFSYFNPSSLSEISARIDNDYQRVRGRVGYYFCQGCHGNLYTFGGVSWLYVEEKDQLNATATNGDSLFMKQESCFNGAGFEAGMGGCLTLFDCFGICGEFNGIGAIGCRSYDFEVRTNETLVPGGFLENDYPDATLCLPGLDLRLEAFYRFTCFCPMTVSVGYEHHQFFNVLLLNPLYNPNAGATSQLQRQHDIGYGGLYVGLKLNY